MESEGSGPIDRSGHTPAARPLAAQSSRLLVATLHSHSSTSAARRQHCHGQRVLLLLLTAPHLSLVMLARSVSNRQPPRPHPAAHFFQPPTSLHSLLTASALPLHPIPLHRASAPPLRTRHGRVVRPSAGRCGRRRRRVQGPGVALVRLRRGPFRRQDSAGGDAQDHSDRRASKDTGACGCQQHTRRPMRRRCRAL